jgi:hypothetical protein
MTKVKEFIEKYGFSYKSYWVAFFVLPPAAIFIAYKMPNTSVVSHKQLELFFSYEYVAMYSPAEFFLEFVCSE